MNKLIKNKKQTTIITLIFSIFSLVLISSIVYSAFSSTMTITGNAHARVEANVRITDFSIKDTTNSSISMYENFTKNTISSSIQLQPNSSITYNLEITNYGTTNVGIFNITGLPSGVNYSIENYNLKDMICDDTGKCNSFAKKKYSLTISTTSSSYEGDLTLIFDFRIFHNVSYTNFNGGYTKNIIDGDTINIDLSYDSPKLVLVTSDKYINYNYSNNILYLENVISDLEIESINTTTYNFDYTGDVQVFTVPYDGLYRLNAWGAQGGSYDNYYGGYGAFTTGEINLSKGEKIYIYVGGQGKSTSEYNVSLDGGYNGGGDIYGYWSTSSTATEIKQSGGGATHIVLDKKSISNIQNLDLLLLVASGGSGSTYFSSDVTNSYAHCYGGHGGGITGGTAICDTNLLEYLIEYSPATQTSPGWSNYYGTINTASFGNGGDGYAGGGGGFYGGSGNYLGFGGGSSYIGNPNLKKKIMYCYNCEESTENKTKTVSTTNVSSTPIINYAKQGNGYASIEILNIKKTYSIDYLGIQGDYPKTAAEGDAITVDFGPNAPSNIQVFENEEISTSYNYLDGVLHIEEIKGDIIVTAYPYTKIFSYTGNSQSYFVPVDGTYKIELWGAQGGYDSYQGEEGGKGGYTSGKINLKKNTKLYVYVGEYPYYTSGNCFSNNPNAAFNASTIGACCVGGGSTDIRLTDGNWHDFSSLKTRIMVSAGGGCATYTGYGGAAGGLTGYQGSGDDGENYFYGPPGTQTSELFGKNTEGSTSIGGGGYYMGSLSWASNSSGGSSFISGHNGCDAIEESSTEENIIHTNQPIHYSGYQFTDTVMIDGEGYNWTTEKGSNTGMPTHDGTSTMIGNEGNGYAKITLIEVN